MVDIQSKEVIDKISDELKIQPSMSIPRVLGKEIQLSYNVNPEHVSTINQSRVRTSSGGITMFTSNTVKKNISN